MSSCIRLALFLCLIATNDTSGASVSDLYKYYHDASFDVVEVTEKLLRNLSKVSKNEDQKASIKKLVKLDIVVKKMESMSVRSDACSYFTAYKGAYSLLNRAAHVRHLFAHELAIGVFDTLIEVGKQWTSKCPQYHPNDKISLFYTLTEEYLSRNANPLIMCCDGKGSVGDGERNFYLRPWGGENYLIYGWVVGVGYKDGIYLSNEGPRLNWYKTWLGGWERFGVESSCFDNYSDLGYIDMCDLVMFQAVDDDSYFMLKERTKTKGPYHYAILDTEGNIPFWKKIE